MPTHLGFKFTLVSSVWSEHTVWDRGVKGSNPLQEIAEMLLPAMAIYTQMLSANVFATIVLIGR